MFRRFISYYKPHKVLFFFDMFASLLIALIGMLYPMLTRKVFSEYVKENNVTKYDKVTKNNRIKQDKLIRDTLKLGENETFIPFSTITKKGREEVYEIIESYL